MSNFVVLGTDTDAGKTTFSLLWMTAFSESYAYWKPFETGDSDSETVRRICPSALVVPPQQRFRDPVAPPLAARREGKSIPLARVVNVPNTTDSKPILIETFGGPFSPLNETELQIELIKHLQFPCVLVSSSAVGAVGRTQSCWKALSVEGVQPAAVVLVGPRDEYAIEQIERYTAIKVFSFDQPSAWNTEELTRLADTHREQLRLLAQSLNKHRLTEDLILRDKAAVWHPYTSLQDPLEPLPVVSAKNEFLHLSDGRTIIDAISSWWTILHGHRPPFLTKALHEATEQLDHVIFGGATHPHAVEVAEALLKTVPWESGGRVFFSDNGSTAVEVALKMAYQWWVHREEPQRTLFIGFENSYHGDTFGAMAVGRDKLFFGTFEPLLFQALQVPVSAKAVEDAILKNPNNIAAVILEPLVQGAGGMKMHSPETLSEIYEVCQKHRILFIADEVMTGGRTGTWWAHQQAKIKPDLICTSKTLAGGMLPLAATLASPKIVQEFQTADRKKTLFHGHSFTANPLACAVAASHFRYLSTGEWLNNVARIRDFWMQHIDVFRRIPRVKDVRHSGTILAIEYDVPGGYLAETGPKIKQFSIEHGVLLRPLGHVLYAMPPLCTTNQSLIRIRDVMIQTLEFLNEDPS